jgi:protein-L-isoaspartate(D-aspartate) O-methyltransferase
MMTKSAFMEKLEKQRQQHQLDEMVRKIDQQFALEPNVKEALSSVDREIFVSNIFKHLSYELDALPMDSEQWISSPLTVAKMTQYLEPNSSCDNVLEIGCGSGYQAAVLSKLFRRVFTIERIDSLLQEARGRFRALGINNINSKFEDGTNGWSSFAPFDRIIFSASPKKIPQVIFDQLAEGGILIAPVEEYGLQTITRYYKRGGKITSEAIETCCFVPVVKGKEH